MLETKNLAFKQGGPDFGWWSLGLGMRAPRMIGEASERGADDLGWRCSGRGLSRGEPFIRPLGRQILGGGGGDHFFWAHPLIKLFWCEQTQ